MAEETYSALSPPQMSLYPFESFREKLLSQLRGMGVGGSGGGEGSGARGNEQSKLLMRCTFIRAIAHSSERGGQTAATCALARSRAFRN